MLNEVQPDMVLVHGDTTTSTATALAVFYQQIPVGHVEAGLRTHNIYSPWPEEMNRQMTSRIATWHFAPTPLSRQNLIAEGIDDSKIVITKNTVIDALHLVLDRIEKDQDVQKRIEDILIKQGIEKALFKSWIGNKKLILITGHRRENFGDGFLNICQGIKELAVRYPEVSFVYPVHLNPNVREPVNEILKDRGNGSLPNVFLIDPLDYIPFVYLMNRSYLVLTDSGGIQEEAPGLGKPVLVMRDTTERPEAVDAGTVLLVGTDKDKIIKEVSRLIEDKEHYKKMSSAVNPYGDGKASERIVEAVKNVFKL